MIVEAAPQLVRHELDLFPPNLGLLHDEFDAGRNVPGVAMLTEGKGAGCSTKLSVPYSSATFPLGYCRSTRPPGRVRRSDFSPPEVGPPHQSNRRADCGHHLD